MAVEKERKDKARGYVDLIKKAHGPTRIYFAVGKDRASEPAVHIDKTRSEACVAILKGKGVGTPLASGRVTLAEGVLTLACARDPDKSAVRKNFVLFFKKAETSIPGVMESSIVVLGPKDLNRGAEKDEREEDNGRAPAELPRSASPPAVSTASGAAPTPAPRPPDTGLQNTLADAWQRVAPEIARAMADQVRKAALQPEITNYQKLCNTGNFDQARVVLERITGLLRNGPAQQDVPPKPNRGAPLMAAWNQMKPDLTKALADPARKGVIQSLAANLRDQMQGGRLDDAQQTLNRLAALLKSDAPAVGPANEPEIQKRWAAAKQTWRNCTETVDKQISQVKSQMASSGDPDFKRIADRGLPALTENHRTPVMRALFELDGPPGNARKNAAAKAQQAIAAFRTHIQSSKLLQALDQHAKVAFGVQMTLRTELERGLSALEQTVRLLAAG